MTLTLFDLDHTLIDIDTNQAWIDFLITSGIRPREPLKSGALAMHERYKSGSTGIDVEFCEFFLATLSGLPREHLNALRETFLETVIVPAASQRARDLVASHRSVHDVTAIITATNGYLTEPIARFFGVDHLIATDPQEAAGQFTGRCLGTPCMREGKVIRLEQWLTTGAIEGVRTRSDLACVRFYSDSINDAPLLLVADEPVVVNPDERLNALATLSGWSRLDLH